MDSKPEERDRVGLEHACTLEAHDLDAAPQASKYGATARSVWNRETGRAARRAGSGVARGAPTER